MVGKVIDRHFNFFALFARAFAWEVTFDTRVDVVSLKVKKTGKLVETVPPTTYIYTNTHEQHTNKFDWKVQLRNYK